MISKGVGFEHQVSYSLALIVRYPSICMRNLVGESFITVKPTLVKIPGYHELDFECSTESGHRLH